MPHCDATDACSLSNSHTRRLLCRSAVPGVVLLGCAPLLLFQERPAALHMRRRVSFPASCLSRHRLRAALRSHPPAWRRTCLPLKVEEGGRVRNRCGQVSRRADTNGAAAVPASTRWAAERRGADRVGGGSELLLGPCAQDRRQGSDLVCATTPGRLLTRSRLVRRGLTALHGRRRLLSGTVALRRQAVKHCRRLVAAMFTRRQLSVGPGSTCHRQLLASP